jgi:hypothetical protein
MHPRQREAWHEDRIRKLDYLDAEKRLSNEFADTIG